MRDEIADSTTNGTGQAADLTRAKIQTMTTDTENHLFDYPDEKVLTLTEYLDVCKHYGLHPTIEIKGNADPLTMDEVAALLSAREEKDRFFGDLVQGTE